MINCKQIREMFNLNDLVNIFKTSQRSTINDNLIIFSAIPTSTNIWHQVKPRGKCNHPQQAQKSQDCLLVKTHFQRNEILTTQTAVLTLRLFCQVDFTPSSNGLSKGSRYWRQLHEGFYGLAPCNN